MNRVVRLVIPVLEGREVNLELSLRHLHSLGVPSWAGVTVVTDGDMMLPEIECEWIRLERPEPCTWGELACRGLHQAKQVGSEQVILLNPGTLPREGTLERLVEISRCRKAVAIPGKIVFPCRSFRSGGLRKSIFGLRPLKHEKRSILECDTFAEALACIPMSVFHLPEAPEFWSVEDLGLILTSNGVKCLVDCDADINVMRSSGPENESWLLTGNSLQRVWKNILKPGNPLNPFKRVRFYTRHWGMFGILHALAPLAKLAVISVIRIVLPLSLLRRIYGHRSVAWQLQQIYDA